MFISACNSTDRDGTAPSTATPGSGAATTTAAPPIAPIVLAGSEADLGLHRWDVMPDGGGIVYTVFVRDGVVALRAVDNSGEPWDIIVAPLREPSFVFDADGDSLLVVDRPAGDGSEPGYRLQSVPTGGGAVTRIAASRNPITAAGSWGDDVVLATQAPRRTIVHAQDTTTRENRVLGEIAGGLVQIEVVDGFAIVVTDSGRRSTITSLPIDGGQPVELPAATSDSNFAVHGATADGAVIVSQSDETTGPIYVTVPDGSGPVEILVDEAWQGTIRRRGETLFYRDGNYLPNQVSIETAESSPAPIEEQDQPAPGVVPGLEADTQRVWRVLSDGRWLVSGSSVDAPEVEYSWESSDDGVREFFSVKLNYLFVYDPDNGSLVQLSATPDFRTTTTATGTGSSPDHILSVRLFGGGEFVAFTTGFQGAAYDVEHGLHITRMPAGG